MVALHLNLVSGLFDLKKKVVIFFLREVFENVQHLELVVFF